MSTFTLREIAEGSREGIAEAIRADTFAQQANGFRFIGPDELQSRLNTNRVALARVEETLKADARATAERRQSDKNRDDLIESQAKEIRELRCALTAAHHEIRKLRSVVTSKITEIERLRAAIETHRGTTDELLRQRDAAAVQTANRRVIVENGGIDHHCFDVALWLTPGQRVVVETPRTPADTIRCKAETNCAAGTPTPRYDKWTGTPGPIIHKEPQRCPDAVWVGEAGEVWDIWLKNGKCL